MDPRDGGHLLCSQEGVYPTTNDTRGVQTPQADGSEDRTQQRGARGTTQPKPSTPSRGQRPCGRRNTQNTQTHTTLGQKKKRSPD